MKPLLTAAEARALDQACIAAGTPGPVLMQRAGAAVAEVAEWALHAQGPSVKGPVAVVCGPGNNGGDGWVAARLLGAHGVAATVYRAGRPERERAGSEAAVHRAAAEAAGVPVVDVSSAEALAAAVPALRAAVVVIDAVLGIGVSEPVRGHLAAVLEVMAALPGHLIAVDLPSGMDSDRGHFWGPPLSCAETVTMALPKLGPAGDPGFQACGRVTVVDLGVPPELVAELEPRAGLVEAEDARAWLPVRGPGAHKGSAGHLLVIAGSPGKTGAALLCGGAALRAGAGLCTLAAPHESQHALDQRVLELMTADLGTQAELGEHPGRAAARALELAAGKRALAIGPGMPTGPAGALLVTVVAREAELPVVLDADALNHLAHELGALGEARGPRVLTPHPGEMARLTGLTTAAVQADRAGVARAFAERHGVVLVLKGARTVVATPDGRISVNPTGNAGLASAGTGDVLTGIIGALLAQGLAAGDAARLGVYLHGLAADRVVAMHGGELLGLLASDLVSELPHTLAAARASD